MASRSRAGRRSSDDRCARRGALLGEPPVRGNGRASSAADRPSSPPTGSGRKTPPPTGSVAPGSWRFVSETRPAPGGAGGLDRGRHIDPAVVFPLAGFTWSHFTDCAELRGADDGPPGRGGWRHPRGAGHVHRGVDLKAPIGHPIVAVEDGTATYSSACLGRNPGAFDMAGHRVCLVGSSGAAYLYFHLGTVLDSPVDAFPRGTRCGDVVVVRAGTVLGFVGHTGGSIATRLQTPARAAHLHFEHHPDGPDGADVNPVRMFERTGGVVMEAAR
jgi:peptidoglycan LD-endopeptidase LytH